MATSISLTVLSASRETRSSASCSEEDTTSEAYDHPSYTVMGILTHQVSVGSVGLEWGRNGVLLGTGHTGHTLQPYRCSPERVLRCPTVQSDSVKTLGFETEEKVPGQKAEHSISRSHEKSATPLTILPQPYRNLELRGARGQPTQPTPQMPATHQGALGDEVPRDQGPH